MARRVKVQVMPAIPTTLVQVTEGGKTDLVKVKNLGPRVVLIITPPPGQRVHTLSPGKHCICHKESQVVLKPC